MLPDLIISTAKLEIEAAGGAEKPARISALAYGGGVLPIGGSRYIIDLNGLQTPVTIPLLADHQNELGAIIGSGRPEKRGGELYIEGILARGTPAADQVIALARASVKLGVSIGIEPESKTYIAPNQTVKANGKTFTADAAGLVFVSKSNLREVSVVPVGADRSATARIAASLKGNQKMDNENITVEIPDEMKAAWDQPGLTDSERVLARWNGATFHESDIRAQTEKYLHAALGGKLSFADFDREVLRAQLRDTELKAIRTERPKGPAIHAGGRDQSGDVLQASLLCHLGAEAVAAKAYGDEVTQRARDARMTSLVEILQAAFHGIGQETPRNRNDLIKAAFSTASVSNIVSDAQNKILLDQWQRLPATWPQLCKQVSASNFKEGKAIRLVGRDTMLDELGPAGEIKHGHLKDSAATFQLATYARMYAITRQDIINDDLGAFNELPKIIARGAGLKMESVFWTLVLGNAGNFFHSDNGNLTDAPLALAGLGTAVALMRNLTGEDGHPILVEPKALVIPPALEATADALFASTNVVVAGTAGTVTTTPAANAFAGKYKPLASPYISNSNYTGYSTTQWYLFADPNVGPAAFVAAFLNGQTAPTIEQSETDFNTLGVQYRGFLDFGFGQCDPEGAVKSSGDA